LHYADKQKKKKPKRPATNAVNDERRTVNDERRTMNVNAWD
jgi:hypothetical protein